MNFAKDNAKDSKEIEGKLLNLTQLWSYLIIDQLVKAGVKTFYTCPGMRNAPLLKAISLHPNALAYSGWDERSQSYRALGFIKSKGEPAALVCTSGTAVANFLPATIEAQKTHTPLIVLSADRPGELNATDANQTINQVEVLRNYCKNFWSASEPQVSFKARALAGKISYLIHDTLTHAPGPLHLNIPLREPLDDSPEEIDGDWKKQALTIIDQATLALRYPETEILPTKETIKSLAKKITEAKNPLVVFGPLHGGAQYKVGEVSNFLNHYQANFSCDVGSGLKYYYGADNGLIPTLDHPEVRKTLENNPPDFILHFGHRITSKHYYGLVEGLVSSGKSKEHILICPGTYHEDPGFSFTQRWTLRPTKVLPLLTTELKELQDIQSNNSLNEERELFDWNELIETKRAIIEQGPLSYPFVTKRAVDTLDSARQVFIGNSTFIRSLDSYAGHYSPNSPWRVISNRGASGIEGHISMTLGMLEANPEKPTLLFLGDVSFIHDMGALITLKEKTPSTAPLLVLLVNNSSGGIFNLLPLAKKEQAKDYLEQLTTPHSTQFTPLLKAMGLNSRLVTDKEGFQQELDKWNTSPTLQFLEIIVNDRDNVEVYEKLKTVKL